MIASDLTKDDITWDVLYIYFVQRRIFPSYTDTTRCLSQLRTKFSGLSAGYIYQEHKFDSRYLIYFEMEISIGASAV